MSNRNKNYRVLIKICGTIILVTGIAMVIPWIYAEISGDATAADAFRRCVPVILILGISLTVLFRSDNPHFGVHDGYLIVSLCWVIASLAGSFPYYLSGASPSFIDAVFESTSGFTTTGSTVLVGGLTSRSLILWKALSHWLGGMGILVFVISILPALGISGQFIVRAETPGPVYQKVTSRISSSARALYLTYFSFTVIEFILLMLSGKMPLYDAVINTLGCISTGGLCAEPSGVAAYGSLYIEIVMAVFCMLASINFVLYHYLITGKITTLLKDIELRAYLIIIASATVLCGINLVTAGGQRPVDALREAFIQTAFSSSTAGYYRSDSFVWPAACQFILLTLIIIGGCSASTAGSVKVVRVLVMFKLMMRGMTRRIHPRSVVAVKLGHNSVSAPVVSHITVFLLTFACLLVLTALILSAQGDDMETSMTTALALLSNTGTAVIHGMTTNEFAIYHPLIKIYMSLIMIAGRLELFTVIILFTRGFWTKR